MKKVIFAAGVALLVAGQSAVADDMGEKVYKQVCFACHMTGAAGAPKVGDKANWGPRIAQGVDTLKEHALKGFKGNSGFMPAKGGRADLSDEEVGAAVEYLVSQGK